MSDVFEEVTIRVAPLVNDPERRVTFNMILTPDWSEKVSRVAFVNGFDEFLTEALVHEYERRAPATEGEESTLKTEGQVFATVRFGREMWESLETIAGENGSHAHELVRKVLSDFIGWWREAGTDKTAPPGGMNETDFRDAIMRVVESNRERFRRAMNDDAPRRTGMAPELGAAYKCDCSTPLSYRGLSHCLNCRRPIPGTTPYTDAARRMAFGDGNLSEMIVGSTQEELDRNAAFYDRRESALTILTELLRSSVIVGNREHDEGLIVEAVRLAEILEHEIRVDKVKPQR